MIRRRTKNYYFGGLVKVNNPTRRERMNVDTQKAILQAGSLVIPKKITPMVLRFLDSIGESYKDEPSQMDPNKIVNAILVVGEAILPPRLAPTVISFLKAKGIHLPNT